MKIATLNCHGFHKQHLSTNTNCHPNNFLIWLCQTQADILALQELQLPNTPTTNDQALYNQYLNTNDSVWTEHCAILLRDPDLSLSNMDTALGGCVITTAVISASFSFSTTFCIMYAPANRTDHRAFLLDCLDLLAHEHPTT